MIIPQTNWFQLHNEMDKVNYISHGDSILRADIKIEDKEQKKFGCYSTDVKVNIVYNCSNNKVSMNKLTKQNKMIHFEIVYIEY